MSISKAVCTCGRAGMICLMHEMGFKQPTDTDMNKATDEWCRVQAADMLILRIREMVKDQSMCYTDTCFAIERDIDNYLKQISNNKRFGS